VKNILNYSDPVGSRAPKFASGAKVMAVEHQFGLGFAILCQAQGFPIPLFR
jgi:hypothetical protein